jgi:peptidoglycan hydrolase CwlO-like protein
MMQEIFLMVVTAVIGYVVGYKKTQNEIEGGRLQNLEKSIQIYQVIIDDLSTKVEGLTAHISTLDARIEKLMDENKRLKKQTI